MKFSYQYKTKDNEKREDVISASSRDDVYRQLKQRGIHPFNVTLAPGFVNRLCSFGKRGLAIVTLAVAVVGLGVLYFRATKTIETIQVPQNSSLRHQLYGDPVVIGEMESAAYANVFTHPGERFLAYYAQPGRDVRIPKSLSALLFANGLKGSDYSVLRSCLTNEIVFVEGEPTEHSEMKRMVNGLKDEMRDFVAECEVSEYVRRLNGRQHEEQMIYLRAVNELKGCKDQRLRDERNRTLRELGLRSVLREKEK